MRLFIAAKASVARVIAEALSTTSRPYERGEGYFYIRSPVGSSHVDKKSVVTWCGGHLFELADPEDYDAKYHQWRLEDLPIIPDEDPTSAKTWKIKERSQGHEQLNVIRRFLGEAEDVVHAGDPDREGQWMIDEVLTYLDNPLPVKRLLIQDLNSVSVRKALKFLRDNKEFMHLSESAMARSHADWLYGINMTRAYTLLGRHSGYEGVLTVGRVQTPVLSLVVKRDVAIEQFKAQHYFDVLAKLANQEDGKFCYARWKLPSGCEQPKDRSTCEHLAKKIQGKQGVVLSRFDEIMSKGPPLPFDLSALQIECGKQWGYLAREVMDICLQLFEKHHLISYPRSNCRHLPEDCFDQSGEVLNAISLMLGDPVEKNNIDLKEKIKKSDCWVKQTCWDDTKVTAHHGIIPTTQHVEMASLSEQEKQVYILIASHYVEQFYPNHQYINSEITFTVEGEEFTVSGKRDALVGWEANNIITCDDVDVREKLTCPPERFTDSTLMEAIECFSTQATRALIIDGLFNRGFLMKGNKSIFSTPIGRDLIHALPEIDQVGMAELWEKKLSDIASGILSCGEFMDEFQKQLVELVENIRQQKVMTVTSVDEVLGLKTSEKFHCEKCQALLVQRKSKHGLFWGCSRYPECKHTHPDSVDKNGHHRPRIAT